MLHRQRINLKFKSKIAACFLSLLLLLVEVGALADQVEHQLHKPDKPCAQCLFANHVGKTPVSALPILSPCAPESYAPPASLPVPRRHEFHAYAVRAPPLDSEI
jgi:hypothetical protein